MRYSTNEKDYDLKIMFLDLNGTLTVWWEIKESTIFLLWKLKKLWWKLILLTGNQRGNADVFEQYGLEIMIAKNAAEKWVVVSQFEKEQVVCVWNARIDKGMFEHACISIVTIQWEWIHASVLNDVDIVVTDIDDALKLFTDSDRFAATMKI